MELHNQWGQFLVNLKEKLACSTLAIKMQGFVNVAREQLAFRLAQHPGINTDGPLSEVTNTVGEACDFFSSAKHLNKNMWWKI